MFSAGSVSATLSGNFSPLGFAQFDAAMKKSHRQMEESEKKMKAAGSRGAGALSMIGKAGAMAAGGGILAFGLAVGKSVSLAADFEQELSRLKATTSATAKQMQTLKKDAMAAGAATKFSALDAAKAQTELAKGGLSVAEIHGGALKAALALAAAGELDLADAAATTVNAMKQFGLEGKQAGHVADALATAANSTTTDVGELGMALRQGGGVAAMAGASFDETVAALSALADASVKGSDAGTSLKSFFLNIASPSGPAIQAMHDLGMNIFTTTGKLKPLPALAENLRQAFGHLTKEQFLNNAGVIAGSDAARALFAIYKAGPQGMQRYLDKQKEVGTASATAATKQDNLRGKIENLKGSLETAGIALGEGLLPGLTKGAEKATDAINKMAASGDLERLGQDIGTVVSSLVEAGPTISKGFHLALDGIGLAVRATATSMVPLVAALAGVLEAVNGIADAFNAVSGVVGGPRIDTGGLANAREDVEHFLGKLQDVASGKHDIKVKVSADTTAAVHKLNELGSKQIKAKAVKILTNGDTTAAQKIRALVALGIPVKTARIMTAGVPKTLADLSAVQGALAGIQSKTVNLTVNKSMRTLLDKPSSMSKRMPKATGRAPGTFERALVGEGRGGELVGNPADGWSWVDLSILWDLRPADAVIPEDPRYSGRALGLMFGMLGVPGYAKGKAPAKKKPVLAIPTAVQFGAVPEDELDASRDAARESYQKRKDHVHDTDVDIRAQRKKVGEAKGAKAKAKARRVLSDMQAKRHRLNDGGDGLQSLAAMRAQWQALQKQATVLHKVNMEIDRLNTMQETDRTKMATASKRGDAGAWGAAKKDRASILETLRAKYAQALKLAKPGSNFQAELAGKLAGIEGEIADAGAEVFDLPESPFEGGLTKGEQAMLTQLQMAQSLAGLTADLGDDQAAAVATQTFLESMLGAAMSDPSRGGPSAIRDLADQVKQARDNVASFLPGGATGAGNADADVAAQLAQRDEELRVSRRNEEIARLSFGALGSGGFTQNVFTLHPGDPATLRAIGDAATGGIGLQPSVSSPRAATGL